jgi:hypothetical protein
MEGQTNETSILAIQNGDVNGDRINDTVYLIGKKSSDSSPLVTDISIIIKDGKNGHTYPIILKENMGYNPTLNLYNFTNENMDNIFVAIDSGGSGGYGYYYIYSFKNNTVTEVFSSESFSNTYNYVVKYKDNYKVEVINKTLKKSFLIDISNKGKEYLETIYNNNGTLKKDINGYVLALNNLYPVDINRDGVFELYALQRVIGLYGADTLGIIITPLYFNKNGFDLFTNQSLSIYSFDI